MSSEAPDVRQIFSLTDSLSQTNRSMCHTMNALAMYVTTNWLTGRQPNKSYKKHNLVTNQPTLSLIDGGFPVDVGFLRS